MIKFTTNANVSLKKAEKKIRRMSKKVDDTKQPHKKIAVYLTRWVGLNFRSEGGNVGGWPPFAYGGRVTTSRKGVAVNDIETRRRVNIDTSAKLLQDSGRLRLSFMPFWSKRNAGIGSKLKYSRPHEEGQGAVPKRRMLPELTDVVEPITDIYIGHVKKAAKELKK